MAGKIGRTTNSAILREVCTSDFHWRAELKLCVYVPETVRRSHSRPTLSLEVYKRRSNAAFFFKTRKSHNSPLSWKTLPSHIQRKWEVGSSRMSMVISLNVWILFIRNFFSLSSNGKPALLRVSFATTETSPPKTFITMAEPGIIAIPWTCANAMCSAGRNILAARLTAVTSHGPHTPDLVPRDFFLLSENKISFKSMSFLVWPWNLANSLTFLHAAPKASPSCYQQWEKSSTPYRKLEGKFFKCTNWPMTTASVYVLLYSLGVRCYILTPWCRVLLEKLTGLQLVKKFPSYHGTRRFITALTRIRHLSLSWASPTQSI